MSELYYIGQRQYQQLLESTLKPLPKAQLFADFTRINTLFMIQQAQSGHIGSSFSSLDIMSHLLLNIVKLKATANTGQDIFFSSKGHDVPAYYAALIGLGLLPQEQLYQLRRLGGLPGHPDIHTPYVYANTGSLGMGISKAKGMILANRLAGQVCRVFVLTGDGELQEGQFWESLLSAVNLHMEELTVIVDCNKIQSDTWVKQVSDLGHLEAKLTGFGWRVKRCNGHDLNSFSLALTEVQQEKNKPKIIIADTVKGHGVSFMDYHKQAPDELYAFHSGAMDIVQYPQAVTELKEKINKQLKAHALAEVEWEVVPFIATAKNLQAQNLVAIYSQCLLEQAQYHTDLVVLDADLMKDCGITAFKKAFPARFIECGIAEQDMVSQASGLALMGKLPVVHSFACFLAARPNEQFYNNASEHTKIIYVATLAGLLPGGPGHSHQSVRDIAALSAIPGLSLIAPAHAEEMRRALQYAVSENPQSTYLRIESVPCDIGFKAPADFPWMPGQGYSLREGKAVALIAYGPWLLNEAFHAAELLTQQGNIQLAVYNLPWLNRLDYHWFKKMLSAYSLLISVDNHFLKGGQGEMLATAIAELELNTTVKLLRLGINNIPACGRNEEVLQSHGLDRTGLATKILQFVSLDSTKGAHGKTSRHSRKQA